MATEEHGDPKIVVGVAAVVLRNDSILLVKRLGSYQGMWCIPCGHIESGEEIREAAVREIREETGLEISVGVVVLDVLMTTHSSGRRTVGVWFEAQETGGELAAGDDASEARFFPLTSPPDNMAFEADTKVIEKLREQLKLSREI